MERQFSTQHRLTCGGKKFGDYYKSYIKIYPSFQDGGFKAKPIVHYSSDVFVNLATARRQAAWWMHESQLCGYVTTA